MVVPLQWAIHMNPNLFTNPQEFDPSRFIAEDMNFTKPDAFIPFQTGKNLFQNNFSSAHSFKEILNDFLFYFEGKRICLGEEYAKMLLFLFGGRILQKFKLSLPEEEPADFEGEVGITLTPKHHKIKFIRRN